MSTSVVSLTISEKNLKREIETPHLAVVIDNLEVPISEKNLKREIETCPFRCCCRSGNFRSARRISSVRLKLHPVHPFLCFFCAISEKNLKREIETIKNTLDKY